MSEEEILDDNVNDEVESDNDEHDILMKQELICIVKANPALYAKNWKEYAGKDL